MSRSSLPSSSSSRICSPKAGQSLSMDSQQTQTSGLVILPAGFYVWHTEL